MTKFVIPEDRKVKNPQASFQLDEDIVRGFKTAVKNNQTRLAMEYLSYIIDIVVAEIDGDEDTPVEKKAVAKKAAAKKTAAARAVVEPDSTDDKTESE